jgi:hypothetical protein
MNIMNYISLGSGNKGKEPSCGKGWTKPENFEKNNQHVKNTKPPMYGVLTGKHNNLIVIDYDIYKTGTQNITLASLKGVHGSTAYIVQTQSGGFHVYHSYEDKFEAWGGIQGVQGFIDIRNTGNYVVGGKSKGYKEVSGNIEKLTPMPDKIFTALDTAIGEMQKSKNKNKGKAKTHDEGVIRILEGIDFSGIVLGDIYDGKQNFDCDQRGVGTECPCCGGQHESNNYFYRVRKDGCMVVKNYSEGCKEKIVDDYKTVRHFFEQEVCRIDDKLNYLVENKVGGKMDMYNKEGIKERFSHLQFQDAKGTHKFMMRWLEDPDKRSFATMDFYPEDCPPNVFNTWKPYAASTLQQSGGSADMFFELLDELTVGDPNRYARKYLATLLQKPNIKPSTCLVFRGVEGTGKGRMFYSLKKVLGKHLVCETSNPAQDVFGTNADAYNQTKLVIMNESNATLNFKNSDRLKALITDEDGLKVNQKYIKAFEIRNLAGTIIAGNGATLVDTGVSGRRFAIYETGEKFLNDEVHFANYTDYIDQPKNQRAIYDALMAEDLEGFHFVKDRPIETRAYREAAEKCLPKFIKFLEWDIMENMAYPVVEHIPAGDYTTRCVEVTKGFEEDVQITATDYCSKFQEWAGGNDRFINSVKFGLGMKKIMKDHKIPEEALRKKETKRGVVYIRNRAKAVEYLKSKNFTSRDALVFD